MINHFSVKEGILSLFARRELFSVEFSSVVRYLNGEQMILCLSENILPSKKKDVIFMVQVIVRDNNVDQALKALKKKMQREGVFREMKLRRNFEKPSEKKAREKAEAVRRARKLERKRLERDGF